MLINSSPKQITLFFDPKSYKGKQTLAYAKDESLPIAEVNICKSPFTGTQLKELAELLAIPLNELVDKEVVLYKETVGNTKDFKDDDWIKILTKHPELIRSPIAMKGKKTIFINTPSDILQL